MKATKAISDPIRKAVSEPLVGARACRARLAAGPKLPRCVLVTLATVMSTARPGATIVVHQLLTPVKG